MDLKIFPPDSVLDGIDRISFSFIDSYCIETRDKLNHVELKRFFDNLFYFLSICSKHFALANGSQEVVEVGSLSHTLNKLSELIAENGQALSPVLKVAVNGSSEIRQMLKAMCSEFKIDNLNYGHFEEKVKSFIERLLRYTFKSFTESKGDESMLINDHFQDQIKVFQRLLTKNLVEKMNSPRASQDSTKILNALSSAENLKNFSMDEDSGSHLNSQLAKIRNEVDTLRSLLQSLKSQTDIGPLESKLFDIQGLINMIPGTLKYPRHTDSLQHMLEAKAHKPAQVPTQIQSPDKIFKEKKLSFLPFYRVKEISRATQAVDTHITPLNLNLVQDLDKSDDKSRINSTSYHFCDLQNKTISSSDDFSPSEEPSPSLSKVCDYWTSRIKAKKNTEAQSRIRKVKEDYAKSFPIPSQDIPQLLVSQRDRPLAKEPVLESFTLSSSFLASIMKAFDPYATEDMQHNAAFSEESISAFFAGIRSRLEAFTSERDALFAQLKETQQKELSAAADIKTLQEQIKEQETRNSAHVELLKQKDDEISNLSLDAKKNKIIITERSSHISKLEERLALIQSSNTQKIVRLKNCLNIFLVRIRELATLSSEINTLREAKALTKTIQLKYKEVLKKTSQAGKHQVEALRGHIAKSKDQLSAYKLKVAKMHEKLDILTQRASSVAAKSDYLIEQSAKSVAHNISKLQHGRQVLKRHHDDLKSSNELLTMEKDHISSMNKNLINELDILSATVKKLTSELEKLEDHLVKQSDYEEKNRHLKIKIKVLKEKLELMTSLKEIAEKNIESSIEERNVHVINLNQNQSTIPLESIQPSYLRTIDENDELAEGAEVQEGHSNQKDNMSAHSKENVLNIKDYIHKTDLNEYQISRSMSILRVEARARRDSGVQCSFKDDSSSRFIQLSPSRESFELNNNDLSNKNLAELKNKERLVAEQPSNKKKILSNIDDNTPNESKKTGNDDPQFLNNSKSSHKKPLFSMQNVLKNIGHPSRPNLSNDFSQKDIIEFKASEEIKETSEKGRKESQPNTTQDECQSSQNNTDLQDVTHYKDAAKRKPLFISSGSNKFIGVGESSLKDQEIKQKTLNLKQAMLKQFDVLDHLSKVLCTHQELLSDKITRLKANIDWVSSQVLSKVLLDEDSRTQRVEEPSKANLIPTAKGNNVVDQSVGRDGFDIHFIGLIFRIRPPQTRTLSFEKADPQGGSMNELKTKLDHANRENVELREQLEILIQQLENATNVNTEYEAVMDYTYSNLKQMIELDDQKGPSDKQLDIQELLEAVTLEFQSLKRQLAQLSHFQKHSKLESSHKGQSYNRNLPQSKDSPKGHKNANDNNYAYIQNIDLVEENEPLDTSSKNSDDPIDNQNVYEQYFQNEGNQIAGFALQQKHGELEAEKRSKTDDDFQATDRNIADYDLQGFKEKQAVLKEAFNDLLTNFLVIIDDNFDLLTRGGNYINDTINTTILSDVSANGENVDHIQNNLIDYMEKVFQNNTQLKEMTEFLNLHLMNFIAEIDTFKEHVLSNVPYTDQVKELMQENDFLYHKLNKSNRKIERLLYHIRKYESEHRGVAKMISKSLKRSSSVPNVSFVSDDSKPGNKGSADLVHKIKAFLRKIVKTDGGPKNVSENNHIKIYDETFSHASADNMGYSNNYTQEKEFIASDREHIQEVPDNRLEMLDQFNTFLLNILKQMKDLVDDVSAPESVRLDRLAEISKDLDAMLFN